MTAIIETERLNLRHLHDQDAPFIFRLVNDPDWLRFIGDRNVHDLDGARRYIANGPAASYIRNGFGLNLVELKESGEPIGLCGLLRRDSLDHPDLGFAFLPDYRAKGYAREAAAATMLHARRSLGIGTVLAITSLDNDRSIALLQRIGFTFERIIRLPGDEESLRLFRSDLPS